MKIETSCTCPGCKHKTTFKTLRPGFLSKLVASVTCSGCDSTLQVRMKRAPEEGRILMDIRVAQISPTLKALLEEEAELRREVEEENRKEEAERIANRAVPNG